MNYVYNEDELQYMSPEQLTSAIEYSASVLLGIDLKMNCALPYGGDDCNPHTKALKSEVPSNIYDPPSVWYETENGTIHFHPWVFRLGFLRAINVYEAKYNQINSIERPFPRKQFSRILRTAKNRAYKQHSRMKNRGTNAEVQANHGLG